MKKILFLIIAAFLISCQPSGNMLWPGGKIPYRAVGFSSDEMVELFSCMMEWQMKTSWSVEFVNVDVVEWNGVDHVTIIRDVTHRGGGTVSGPGYNPELPQYYIIGDCPIYSTRYAFLHELGHIIGVDHEHQRPDRDIYISINWENVDEDQKGIALIATIPTEPSFYDWQGYPYDYASIMHYREFKVVDFHGHEELAMKDEVSEIDAWKVRDMYTQEDTDGELEF